MISLESYSDFIEEEVKSKKVKKGKKTFERNKYERLQAYLNQRDIVEENHNQRKKGSPSGKKDKEPKTPTKVKTGKSKRSLLKK